MAVADPAQDLALILASISEGLAVYDADGYMRLVNDRGRFLLGLPPGLEKASLADRAAIEQVADEDGTPVPVEKAPVYRALHGETTRQRVLRISPSGQPPRWLRFSASPLLDADGKPCGAVATFDDVTREHELEEQLRATQWRYQKVFEHSLDAIFLASADGRIEAANPAACRMLGMEEEEICRGGRSAIVEPTPEVEAMLKQRERTGEGRGEVLFRRKDGSRIICDTSSAAFIDEQGEERAIVVARDITKRKRAEQALRESEERFRQLADAMPVLVWTALPDGTVDYYNQRFRDFPGLEPQPDGKWVWQPQLHPDDRQATVEAWARAVQSGEDYEITQRIKVGESVYRWYLTRGVPARDASGRIVRWYGTSTDIDWQKRAEQQLRESEERFHQLADAMPQLVWTARPDGTLDYYNARAREFSGMEPQPDGSWSWEHSVHPDDLPATIEIWRRAMRLGAPYEIAYRIRRRDGGYRWYLTRAVPVRDASGKVVRWYGTATDIDWQKQAERVLKESEEQLRQLADAMPQLVWMARPDGQVDYVNARAREYRNLERQPDGSWDWLPALHPDDVGPMAKAWERSWRNGEMYERACRFRLLDGSYRWHLVRGLPVRDGAGNVVRWYGTSTDIDWQKKAELELIEAGRLRDRALASIAHELRNPLSAINTAIHLLQRRTSPESTRRAAETIGRQARHLNRLVGDLLDSARVSQGKLHVEMERLELGELVRRVVEDYRPLFDQQGIELELSRCAEPLFGQGDATRLTQAIGNVLDNAAKFTPRGGRVGVTVEAEPSFAVVRIKDTGAGIPQQVLERIFCQFVQADEALERKRSGLGLGLALVKGIVELHGGRVLAFSEGPGRGSEFVLRLPIEPQAQAEAQPPTT